MCGIAGYIGTKRIDEARADACLGRMHHRGPDGHGVYRHERNGRHCLLLHTRLAILDLDDRAAQPMRHGGHVLAFNGELYNYLELKEQLETRGEGFATDSDTEVLLKQLATHGPGGLDACEGMWAFAMYDENDGSFLLCRDRFGEKPLYLHRDRTGLYFASEIKLLMELAGKRFQPNMTQLRRYLVHGYKSLHKRPDTFFHEVFELPAAQVLQVDSAGDEHRGRYWKVSTQQHQDMTFAEAVSGVRERLLRAVEIRLRSDVPLAFCMSGGIDSNALISIAKNVFGYEVHGFTVLSPDARYDESSLVRKAVETQGLRHTFVTPEPDDFMADMRSLVLQHDGPVVTISYYVQWLLLREMAGQGYKVSVSGTAADELFTGYYDHFLLHLAAVWDSPDQAAALADWKEHVAPVVRNPYLQNPEAFVRNPDMRDHILLGAEQFSQRLCEPFHEAFTEREYAADGLRSRMLNELFHEVVPVILHEDDLNAMSVSMENRSPFLDRQLFDFCQTIPSRHLVRGGYAKAVLREAVRGIAPDPIVNERRKVGFNYALHDALDVSSPGVVQWLLRESPVFELVDREAIRQLVEGPQASNSESKFFYSFVNVKLFLEAFA